MESRTASATARLGSVPTQISDVSGLLPGLRVAATALLVCAAYYVGANIGFVLRLPPTTPSVLWLPNAILTAAFLLAPVRQWWIYLLAALPAHLIAELSAGFPLPLVLALFGTNCSEALIGAWSVRLFSDAPTRLDTLRRVIVFVMGAGLFGPFASSFFDAGVIAGLRGEPYWLVWRTRFFANVVTELTLVPAVMVVATSGASWIRGAAPMRKLEAGIIALCLLTVAAIYVVNQPADPWAALASPQAPVAFFVPFVLLAAVRFGPGGGSLSLFITTLIVTWVDTHGRGRFLPPPSRESVLALQLTLSVSAIPLLCLAGLIEERWRVQQAQAERLRFEELLARLSGGFVHLPSDQMDEVFETWLGRLGQLLNLDRVLLLRIMPDGLGFRVAYSWAATGLPPMAPIIVSGDFPWTIGRLLREQPMALSSPSDLPEEAARDKESLGRYGIKSKLALPLVSSGRVFGGLVLETMATERTWPDELVNRFQLVAEVFANALARKETEDALRASELLKSAILASLDSSVGVLDHRGQLIAVNADWVRFGAHQGSGSPRTAGLGANYLDVHREAARRGKPHATEALAGIEGVLDKSLPGFSFEYPYPTFSGERWFAMSVVPLNQPDGGAVVSYTDVTERKRAEMEAQRSRQELAHFTRVSTMGELTASLAHELNQPLTGIMTNAQAARRFLDMTPPDLPELRSILGDIIEDDKRAADVIQRLRDLLRKGESQVGPIDLNCLIRDVVKLLGSDTVIRNVNVALDLDDREAFVVADRVQIQQVVLNLVLNAMEAMADGTRGRELVVRTRNTETMGVQVAVEDSGPGLREGTSELVFEPFYTTKTEGMGMGLAIARSIIEAHGGLIWAENHPSGGAVFKFRLPMAAGRTA